MKFNVRQVKTNVIEIGNVYLAKGPGPSYWVVVAITPRGGAHMLGIDEEGNIVSTTSYGAHVLHDRRLVGRCEDLKSLVFEVKEVDDEAK